jgi:hypothetical protein
MSQPATKIPAGIHLSAVATQQFEFIGGVSAKGKPYQKVVGRGVAGEKFVKITEFLDPGQAPLIFGAGEQFEADITGVDTFEKGREVISLFVKLRRPVVAEVKK